MKFLLGYCIVAGLVIVGLVVLILSQQPPEPATTNSAAVAPTPAESASPETTNFVLFVPNDNAELEPHTVPDTSTPADAPYAQKARRALDLLFPKLDFLPKGTRLLSAPTRESANVVRLNFSKEFLKLDSQPETPVMLTLDSMARTLGAIDSQDGKDLKPIKVRVQVEGKNISTLSQFTLEDPWTASETAPPETLRSEDAV